MKLYSKEIKVGTKKINCTVTQELIDDLKNMKGWDEITREQELRMKQELRKKKITQINKISNEE